MSQIVDPLKASSFGVKKPMDERIHKVLQKKEGEYKRYYPLNRKGDLDEWGAMIR